MDENVAVVLKKEREFVLEKRSIPKPNKNEVLIRMKTIGLVSFFFFLALSFSPLFHIFV